MCVILISKVYIYTLSIQFEMLSEGLLSMGSRCEFRVDSPRGLPLRANTCRGKARSGCHWYVCIWHSAFLYTRLAFTRVYYVHRERQLVFIRLVSTAFHLHDGGKRYGRGNWAVTGGKPRPPAE